jgi:hypothetical protein
MQAGSVTVAGDGSYTGSGLAKALMDAHVTNVEALVASQVAASQIPTTTTSQAAMKLSIRQALAAQANAYASAVVTYFQANATAHVTTQVLGLTPTKDPVPANTAIQPPASAVDIPIT